MNRGKRTTELEQNISCALGIEWVRPLEMRHERISSDEFGHNKDCAIREPISPKILATLAWRIWEARFAHRKRSLLRASATSGCKTLAMRRLLSLLVAE